MRQRLTPLKVQVLHGSVADASEELRNTDAVIALELIEHVYEDVLAKIPVNIFGFMQPKIVIFSTPNFDFNTIFTRFSSLLPNGFRHADHKFEWTREEFKSWCLGITEKYTNYMFSLLGVGDPPQGEEAVGHVSQIALFVRKDILGMPLAEPLTIQPLPDSSMSTYKTLRVVDFPFHTDERTPEQKIWNEVENQLYQCTKDENNYDTERYAYKLSLDELTQRLSYLGATRELLAKLLEQHEKTVENDFIFIEDNEETEDNRNWPEPVYEQNEQSEAMQAYVEDENWDE
ncbi:hypothetical protein AWZ03_001890 [Drosophila navojoa]|uniref:Small RNA 2'-O-methyltransferase n=2 Tax=Drosophila navojoa TaxID=7232 RepID=A0A484BUT9_DRONA|nr:hypothetical protein AWZ03_001890 [Drosophila navojoa]